jgi:CheY-like chemotaxis protein
MDMQKFKILIVDDNPKNLQVLGNLLEKNHYHVEYALSGSEALEWIKSEQFDLLLLDIMMPGMDGYEVCEIIRKD